MDQEKDSLILGEKEVKTTHKQTCAQTTPEQCLRWTIPPFVTPSPILLPSMAIVYRKPLLLCVSCPGYVPIWTFTFPSTNDSKILLLQT